MISYKSESQLEGDFLETIKEMRGDAQKHTDRHKKGVPDIDFSLPRYGNIWAELKFALDGKVMLRPGQGSWLRRRAAAGGASFLVIYTPNGDESRLWWVDGDSVLPGFADNFRNVHRNPIQMLWETMYGTVHVPESGFRFTRCREHPDLAEQIRSHLAAWDHRSEIESELERIRRVR